MGCRGRSGAGLPSLPSASLGTVRRGAAAKALTGFTFGSGAGDADGADGLSTPFSGEAWLRVAAMLMVRVRARPSRSKRSRCRSFAGRLPPDAADPKAPERYPARPWTLQPALLLPLPRAPRRSVALPVHTVRSVRELINARTAEATGSASITPSTASSRLPQ